MEISDPYKKIYASSLDAWQKQVELSTDKDAKADEKVALTISKSGIIGHLLGWNVNVYVSSPDDPEGVPKKLVRVTRSSVERVLQGTTSKIDTSKLGERLVAHIEALKSQSTVTIIPQPLHTENLGPPLNVEQRLNIDRMSPNEIQIEFFTTYQRGGGEDYEKRIQKIQKLTQDEVRAIVEKMQTFHDAIRRCFLPHLAPEHICEIPDSDLVYAINRMVDAKSPKGGRRTEDVEAFCAKVVESMTPKQLNIFFSPGDFNYNYHAYFKYIPTQRLIQHKELLGNYSGDDVHNLFANRAKDDKISLARCFIDNGWADRLIFFVSLEDFNEIRYDLNLNDEIYKFFILGTDEKEHRLEVLRKLTAGNVAAIVSKYEGDENILQERFLAHLFPEQICALSDTRIRSILKSKTGDRKFCERVVGAMQSRQFKQFFMSSINKNYVTYIPISQLLEQDKDWLAKRTNQEVRDIVLERGDETAQRFKFFIDNGLGHRLHEALSEEEYNGLI